MLLTKKRLHKIRKTKLQSRRRYKKRGGKRRKRRRRGKSFRKRRALNLRRKSLKKYLQHGGNGNDLLFILPKAFAPGESVVNTLFLMKSNK